MNQKRVTQIIGWIARIYGTVILIIPLIALVQVAMGDRTFVDDWRNYVLYISLILGLTMAYKWSLLGGIITTVGILVSGFIHPIILPPGILYIVYGILTRGGNTNQKSNSQ